MQQLAAAVRYFVIDEDGATMVEYGLMLLLVSLACVVAVSLVGTNLVPKFAAAAAGVGAAGS